MGNQGDVDVKALLDTIALQAAQIEAYRVAVDVIREQRKDADEFGAGLVASVITLQEKIEQLRWMARLSADER